MPVVREGKRPTALLVSDIHLSSKAPPARAENHEEWFEVQHSYLKQLEAISMEHEVPILCCGDIFHYHSPNPELLNFAMENIPFMWAIPGNHDLKNHSLKNIHKSGYWSLVLAGKIANIRPPKHPEEKSSLFSFVKPFCWDIEDTPTPISVYGFPFGTEPIANPNPRDMYQEIALVHRYTWKGEFGHQGAQNKHHVKRLVRTMTDYDVVAIGDNHTPWKYKNFFNVGGFMRRNVKEIQLQPRLGLVYSDNTIKSIPLDCSKDKFSEIIHLPDPNIELVEGLLEAVREECSNSIDFRDRVIRSLDGLRIDPVVKRIVLESLDTGE